MSDLGNALRFAVSAASRYFKNFSDIKSKTEAGPGQLYHYRDPQNNRRRLVVLTPKGRKLYERTPGEEVLESQKEIPAVGKGHDAASTVRAPWGNFKVRSNKRAWISSHAACWEVSL